MRSLGVVFVAVASVGCGGGASALGPIYLDGTSDEAAQVLITRVTSNGATTNDPKAAQLTGPGGNTVAKATAPTFTWSQPAMKAPHGTNSGRYIWVTFAGGGLGEQAFHVFAIASTSYTPDADTWARVAGGTAPLQVQIFTALFDVGVIVEGPFKPTVASKTYTITR
jgi:hypothetical protein